MSVSFPCYSTPDLKLFLCLECYRGAAQQKNELFSVLLSSPSPVYYPYEGRSMKEPVLSFPGSLMSRVSWECQGCGKDSIPGRVRWVCVGCAFIDGQSCALCALCVEKMERQE